MKPKTTKTCNMHEALANIVIKLYEMTKSQIKHTYATKNGDLLHICNKTPLHPILIHLFPKYTETNNNSRKTNKIVAMTTQFIISILL